MTPQITIFVRHSAGCKHEADAFAKRCQCRKHLRWFKDGKLRTKKAGTRSWAEAEQAKRDLEDQLSGRSDAAEVKTIREAVQVYLSDKRVQGVNLETIARYERELNRLVTYAERKSAFTVSAVTRELLTGFCGTWEAMYPSSVTRSKARERLRGFLRFCYEAEWLPRVPVLPKIKAEYPPTMPLSAEEFRRLLDSIPVAMPGGGPWDQATSKRRKTRALFLLMRWSGLSIRDALCLRRDAIHFDRGAYRVVTSRQKTGTDVSVPLPPDVAVEVLSVPNKHSEEYLFWSGNGSRKHHTTKFQTRCVLPVFKAAGLLGAGHMVSHRLRDTFAVDLLEKGVPMEEVSKALGHTSIKTTERHYAKWVRGRQDRLDSLVMGTWTTPAEESTAATVN